MLGFGSKSIRPNEIDAVINKFTNCFNIIKEKEYWRLQIKKGFPRVFDSDEDVLTYWKGRGEVDIFTTFHLVLNSDNDFGYEFFANLETKNIKVVDNTIEFVVPEGNYFMMGDNRDNSNDSRKDVGFVPFENIEGKARFLFYSHDDSSVWYNPISWLKAVRWKRLFNKIV